MRTRQWMMLTTPELLGEVGTAVREMRIQRRLTRQDLAERAGVGERTLADLETGNGSRLATLIDVLRTLRAIDPVMNALTTGQEISPMALFKAKQAKPASPKRVRVRAGGAKSSAQPETTAIGKKSNG